MTVSHIKMGLDRARTEWKKKLTLNKDGTAYQQTMANAAVVFSYSDEWQQVLSYNQFSGRINVMRSGPAIDGVPACVAGDWSDEDDLRATVWLSRNHHINLSPRVVNEAITFVAHQQSSHPVRERLRAETWDRVARVDHLFHMYFGADDTPYSRACSRIFLLSAVARVMRPGCKVDTVPILEGNQGIGKSRACRALAMQDKWFSEFTEELGSKDSYQLIRGKWIVEMGELDSLSRSATTRIKSFISSPIDNYRRSYGRTSQDVPRQCVFIGTTNAERYLKDETGARRFLPIRCGAISVEKLSDALPQLWAEAVARYDEGEAWWHVQNSVDPGFEAEQEARGVVDSWEGVIRKWLYDPMHTYRLTSGVSTSDILGTTLGIDVGKWTHSDTVRVGVILRKLKWITMRPREDDGTRQRLYYPPR